MQGKVRTVTRQLARHGQNRRDAYAACQQQVLAGGMNDYITKPIAPRLLYKTIYKWVRAQAPEDYDAVEQALADHNINVAMSELSLIPDNTIAVTGEDAEKVQKMIDSFDELDDVQDVYTNADLPDEE